MAAAARSLDLAEPAVDACFVDADAGVFMVAGCGVGAVAVAEFEFSGLEVLLELGPLGAGGLSVLVGRTRGAAGDEEGAVKADSVVVEQAGQGWIVFGVGELIVGLSMGLSNANEMGYRQSITPDHLQGRTNATMRSINRTMIVVGAPLGGCFADAIGFRFALSLATAGFLAVAAGLAGSPFRGVRLEDAADPLTWRRTDGPARSRTFRRWRTPRRN